MTNVRCPTSILVNNPKTSHVDGEEEQNVNSGSAPSAAQISCQEEGGEEEQGEEKMCDEGQEVEKEEELCEVTPEEEEVKVEWPTGVPQASDKDLAKLSHTEGVGVHSFCVCLPLPLIVITSGGINLSFGSISRHLFKIFPSFHPSLIPCICPSFLSLLPPFFTVHYTVSVPHSDPHPFVFAGTLPQKILHVPLVRSSSTS